VLRVLVVEGDDVLGFVGVLAGGWVDLLVGVKAKVGEVEWETWSGAREGRAAAGGGVEEAG